MFERRATSDPRRLADGLQRLQDAGLKITVKTSLEPLECDVLATWRDEEVWLGFDSSGFDEWRDEALLTYWLQRQLEAVAIVGYGMSSPPCGCYVVATEVCSSEGAKSYEAETLIDVLMLALLDITERRRARRS